MTSVEGSEPKTTLAGWFQSPLPPRRELVKLQSHRLVRGSGVH